MKKVFFLAFLFSASISSGQKITLSGSIYDASNKEPIAGAVIFNKTDSIYTLSNTYGGYSIKITSGKEAVIQVSFIGYTTATYRVKSDTDTEHDFYLKKSYKEIPEITILARKPQSGDKYTISDMEVKALPSLTGDFDILKSFQYMPGVLFGPEGTSNLFVLGGSADQNLITIDDIPIIYVTHLGNFVSVFDIEAIRKAMLVKSGFDPKYGGKQSSFLDIILKNGDMRKRNFVVNTGILSLKLSSNGYIVKDKLSYLVTLRRSNLDWLEQARQLLLKDDYIVLQNFYDANFKVNYKPNKYNTIQLITYSGSDRYKMKISGSYDQSLQETSTNLDNNISYYNGLYKWGNLAYGLKWIYNKNKIFINTTAGYTRFSYNFSTDNIAYDSNGVFVEEHSTDKKNFIGYYFVKSDWNYIFSPSFKLNLGVDYKYYKNLPIFYRIYKKTSNEESEYRIEEPEYNKGLAAGYMDLRYNYKRIVYAKIGLRTTLYDNQIYLSPRFRATVSPFDNIEINASYTKTYQFVHLLQSSTSIVPSDIWILSQKEAQPEFSQLYDVNVGYSSERVESSAGVFRKSFNNLLDYKRMFFYLTSSLWDKLEYNGTGLAYGAYFMTKFYGKKFNSRVSFTYMNNQRTFKNLNNGEPFPSYYTRRYNLNLSGVYKFNKHWQASALFYFASGMPYTIPTYSYNSVRQITLLRVIGEPEDAGWGPLSPVTYYFFDKELFYYGEINNYTLPVYHRLDLSVKYSWSSKNKKIEHGLTLNVYNVYNRMNPYYVFAVVTSSDIKYYKYTLLPVLPSLSYIIRF